MGVQGPTADPVGRWVHVDDILDRRGRVGIGRVEFRAWDDRPATEGELQTARDGAAAVDVIQRERLATSDWSDPPVLRDAVVAHNAGLVPGERRLTIRFPRLQPTPEPGTANECHVCRLTRDYPDIAAFYASDRYRRFSVRVQHFRPAVRPWVPRHDVWCPLQG